MLTYLLKMHYKFGYGIDDQLICKNFVINIFKNRNSIFVLLKNKSEKEKKSILGMTIECKLTAVIYFKRLPQKEEAVDK